LHFFIIIIQYNQQLELKMLLYINMLQLENDDRGMHCDQVSVADSNNF